jgi:hypothetical protein
MRRWVLAAVVLGALGTVSAVAGVGGGDRAARAARGPTLTPFQNRLLSGAALRALEQPKPATVAPLRQPDQQQQQQGIGPTNATGCPNNRGPNIQVNQDCQNLTDPDLAGRGEAQNETAVAQDPNNPSHLVVSQNDYRRGDSSCYTAYSTNGGKSWADSTLPFSFTRGDAFGGLPRQYWQAGGDPTVAWDSKGNAYQTCLVFQRGPATTQNPDLSSAFYLFRSTGTNGASWNFPGRPVAELNDQTGERLLDKEYMTIDNHKGSPFQDRIYVTWTLFDDDGTAYIFGAYSRDYGETFSTPKLVSADSDACPDVLGVPTPQGRCNENSFSQPFTGPDGALYVVWENFNVTGEAARGEGDEEGGGGDSANSNQAAPAGVDNAQQVLLAKSTDGGNTFSAPVRVSLAYELPDCETYQDATGGSACVPEKGETQNSIFRAANYPSGAVNPKDPREVTVSLGSYINRHSNERNGCVPQGFNPDTAIARYDGVKQAGACNNDIVISSSSNGGRTFTGTNGDVRRLPTVSDRNDSADQFWQWAAYDPKGRFAVSYYDRAYGNDEQTGFSDVSLSGSRDGEDFATERVTTSSMPPPSEFAGGFYGDYSALSAGDVAHPVWMDTRDPELFVCRDSAGQVTQPPSRCTASAANAAVANDQDIYTASMQIPTP